MISVGYIFSRILKKMRGSAVRDSVIGHDSKIESGSTVVRSMFGRHSFCGYDCTIIDAKIGSFCSIAGRVIIGAARHPMEYVSTSPVFLSHKDSIKTKFSKHEYFSRVTTEIGNDVWIGEGAFIKGGISIGHGAVVGMGSVVTKDVPPYAIVVGNPSRIIRFRFSRDVIDALLKMGWWDFSEDELRSIAGEFKDPKSLLRKRGLL